MPPNMAMAAAGLTEDQSRAVAGLIAAALDRAGSDAARNLQDTYAQQTRIANEMSAQQAEMKESPKHLITKQPSPRRASRAGSWAPFMEQT